jgi:uncharacterized lipoprotein YmbA
MRQAAILLMAAWGLAGCTSADPNFYTLQTVPGAAGAGGPASVEVRRPGLAGYLDRSDIVLKQADYRLAVNSDQRWGEPLGDMIGRVLTQDLSQRLPGTSVFSQSGAITADPQARVEVDILNFDADGTGGVVLNAQVAVEIGTSHRPVAAHHVALRGEMSGPGAGALVAAMSGLLGQLADQAASDVRLIGPGALSPR